MCFYSAVLYIVLCIKSIIVLRKGKFINEQNWNQISFKIFFYKVKFKNR